MAGPVDFSKTQRIVLLIDLHPLLAFQNRNPNPYLTPILAAAKRLLDFAPLSNTLSAFKFFFSSLSPIRSASEVHRLLPNPIFNSLSFNNCSQTLTSLTAVIDTLSTAQVSDKLSNGRPCASHAASSLLQLVHDYAWESESENFRGKVNNNFQMLRSNLVILFSPVCRSIHAFSEYLEMDSVSQVLSDSDGMLFKFRNIFGAVKDAFLSKDIHFSWVDVRCKIEGNEEELQTNGCETQLPPVLNAVTLLGWGFCSTDTIVLGSALVPFGLIYPMIGVSFSFVNLNDSCKRTGVQLSLGILDVSGKPLECNCCDLELLNLKGLHAHGCDEMLSTLVFGDSQTEMFDPSKTMINEFLGGMTKICIKAVQRYNKEDKIETSSADTILVREYLRKSKKPTKKPQNDFFAAKVLHMLSEDSNQLEDRNSMPIWQILLSFLYKEGNWALVSISNSNGHEALGMLKPLTVHFALLSLINSDPVHGCSVPDLNKIHEIHEICADTGNFMGLNSSQSETSTSGSCDPSNIGKKKRKIKHLNQDLTWSSFCRTASEYSEFDLAAAYFARYFDRKKLKFLKCWMKQIIRYCPNCLSILRKSNYGGEASIFPNFPSEPSRIQEGPAFATTSENPEAFLTNLPKKIQHGIESGMDLATFAERLVKSSIHSCQAWNNEKMELQDPEIRADDSCKPLCTKLTKLLLRDPKKMKDLNEFMDPSAKTFYSNPVSERIVREYELQVLLRMEILRSNVSETMEEPMKQKMLKQICSFLEIIQFLIDGGIHGNVTLYEYVERTIKTRYYNILEDVVNKIYVQMDLLPFGDEDENQAVLCNSEDSSQSWRDTREMPDMFDMHRSVSEEDEPDQPLENVDESTAGVSKDEHARKLNEARERRERARRFVSFTSWKPDLQRVWAPKQPKAVKGSSDSLHKDSKRKDVVSACCSIVHETPMTERKWPYSVENSVEDDEFKDRGNYSHHVAKALFQDD